ncbi:MAG TPA: tetratricopeptide repeat protein [Longimicrobium sp.]|jgi:predicted ATPase
MADSADLAVRPAALSRGPLPRRLRALHSELKRRRVYATATAYAVAAAGAIQLADVVAGALELPKDTVTLVLYVALAGLPLVLVLSWAFALRREGAAGVGAAAAGEDEAVPPAAALLPHHATEFVGRAAELEEAGRLLAAPGCRLLTVTGPGGIGKTRLALEAARGAAGRFRDGVRFAALAGVASPERLAPALAEALGVRVSGREDPRARLLDYLRGKELLLVLDNLEEVTAGAGGLLAAVLEGAPGVRLLATSRERLGLSAETVLPLEGLSPPEGDGAAALERSDAARLFAAGARRACPGWRPAADDRPHLAHICRLVEGSPLALELASAWVRLLSCAEIAREIEGDRDFLAGPAADRPERHRSLRAVFEGSWRLLPEAERAALLGTSVFRGGFTREAAEAVAGAALPLLGALHDRSLLRRAGAGRFEVPEALRRYAEEKLRLDDGERRRAEARHRAFYAGLLRDAAAAAAGGGEDEALAAVAADLENVRRAWEAMVEARAAGELDRALDGLFLFYHSRGWAREGEAALAAAAAALEGEDAHAGVLARLRARRGAFCARLGAYAQARELLEAAAAHFRRAGPAPELALALDQLGVVAQSQGEYSEARRLHHEALAGYRAAGDRRGEGEVLTHLGNVASALGDYGEAERLFRQGLAALREAGDRGGTYSPLCNLGVIASMRGDFAVADGFYAEGLAVAREAGNRGGEANLLLNLGVAATDAGDPARAEPYLRECAEISREMGYDRLVAFALNGLAHVALARDDDAGADALAREALATAARMEETPVVLESLTTLARLRLRGGDAGRALELVSLVREHPATDSSTRVIAAGIADEAEAGLPPAALHAAVIRGSALPLEQVVKEVLEEPAQAGIEVVAA